MNIKEFIVEKWMTDHENDCLYNLTDTCISPLTIKQIEEISQTDIIGELSQIKLDYGPITGSIRLKRAILSLYQQGDMENISITNGASSANEHVMKALLSSNDHIITFFPSYQQFYSYPEMLECKCDLIELKEENRWQTSVDEIVSHIVPETKMIIMNSPNNPTGTLLDKNFLLKLIDVCKERHIYILIDEIYQGLYEINSISDLYEYGISTSSLSKIYACAGLRLGWIKASKDVIQIIDKWRDYTLISTGMIDDYLASFILEHKELIIERSRKICEANKKILADYLKKEKRVSCIIPKDGTVSFLKYYLPIHSIQLCEGLQKEYGVFFVPGEAFGCDYHLRMTFTGSPEKTKKGLELLSKYFNKFNF